MTDNLAVDEYTFRRTGDRGRGILPGAGGMLETAENLRREYRISRKEQDELAVSSPNRAAAALSESRFDDSTSSTVFRLCPSRRLATAGRRNDDLSRRGRDAPRRDLRVV